METYGMEGEYRWKNPEFNWTCRIQCTSYVGKVARLQAKGMSPGVDMRTPWSQWRSHAIAGHFIATSSRFSNEELLLISATD